MRTSRSTWFRERSRVGSTGMLATKDVPETLASCYTESTSPGTTIYVKMYIVEDRVTAQS